MKGFKERLKEAMGQNGMTNYKLAKATGLSASTIANWLNGTTEPDSTKLDVVGLNLDCNPDWLLTGIGPMISPRKINNDFKVKAYPEKINPSRHNIYENHLEDALVQRIKDIIQYLNISNKEFSIRIGIPEDSLTEILNRNASVKAYVLQSIVESFKITSLDWLIAGKGSMLKTAEESSIGTPEEQTSEESNTVNYRLVPLLNLDAVGGMHDLNTESDSSEYIERLIPFTDAQDGDIALFVSGNSMDPTCPAGSKVLIREVTQWNEYFGFGNIFVLLLTDGRRILKEVQKWQEDPKNFVLCRSHNGKYPEEELPKSMIAGVWKVIKILNERGW